MCGRCAMFFFLLFWSYAWRKPYVYYKQRCMWTHLSVARLNSGKTAYSSDGLFGFDEPLSHVVCAVGSHRSLFCAVHLPRSISPWRHHHWRSFPHPWGSNNSELHCRKWLLSSSASHLQQVSVHCGEFSHEGQTKRGLHWTYLFTYLFCHCLSLWLYVGH